MRNVKFFEQARKSKTPSPWRGLMARFLSLDDVNLEGKTVLLRVDINSPLDPETKIFLDDNRIRAIVPTMNKLTKSKVVILAHQSRPGKLDFTSTLGHSRELARILGRQVQWVDDIYGEKALQKIDSMNDGDILMLQNVRMDKEEISVKGDFQTLAETKLVQTLSGIADIFVNDAFACAHRGTPSIVGFTLSLPCIAGELMRNELEKLSKAMDNPARPCLAVMGGIKVDDSINVADNMLRKGIADELWVTGGVANLLVEISGTDIGSANHDFLVKELGKSWNETVECAKGLMTDFADKIHLPIDLAANVEGNRIDLAIQDLPIEAPLFDLGLKSTVRLSAAIKSAGTIILNGPAGVFEMPDFALGTVEMLNACAESNGFAVMGGGHTATLVMQRGLEEKMGHVSTGGGACLDFMAGKVLPAILSLETSAKHFQTSITRTISL